MIITFQIEICGHRLLLLLLLLEEERQRLEPEEEEEQKRRATSQRDEQRRRGKVLTRNDQNKLTLWRAALSLVPFFLLSLQPLESARKSSLFQKGGGKICSAQLLLSFWLILENTQTIVWPPSSKFTLHCSLDAAQGPLQNRSLG